MSNVCVCVLVALLISAGLDAAAPGDNQSEPRCEKWGLRFAEGNSVSIPGQCMQATCTKASNNEFSTLECPVYRLIAGCHLTEQDLSKSYPDCCPQPVCPKEGDKCKKWGIEAIEGQTISVPGQCQQATCLSNTEFSVQECPVYDLIPGCHVTEEDLSKSYPECCPQAICPQA